ncbi:Fcf2-domain-containing protein [Serendipita vermifera]|nr:Fcf2-domain-containing protein [Serendipita vermifera]
MDKNGNDNAGDSDSDFEFYSPAYLEGLLEKAKATATKDDNSKKIVTHEEDILFLKNEDENLKPLPSLDLQRLVPQPYFNNVKDKKAAPTLSRDLLVEGPLTTSSAPPPLPPQPPVDKAGKVLTKRQVQELRRKEKKPGYFELPTPDAAELAKIKKEAEAIKLRNSLDPKKFYRKDSVINSKTIPKQIALGTIVTTTTPFGTASTENLTRAERKANVVEELVADSEARRYAKRKFDELQSVHGERGRDTWTRKRIARKSKW